MASFSRTIIAGNLGNDPETRYLPSGDAVANFSVAVTESWKDKNSGEKKEQTTWYRVSAFGKLAEICGQYLQKGSSVLIEGKMQCRQYEKDGVKRDAWELKADSMQMLGSKGDGGQHGESKPAPARSYAPSSQQQKPASGRPAAPLDDMDDDIPF